MVLVVACRYNRAINFLHLVFEVKAVMGRQAGRCGVKTGQLA